MGSGYSQDSKATKQVVKRNTVILCVHSAGVCLIDRTYHALHMPMERDPHTDTSLRTDFDENEAEASATWLGVLPAP